MNEIFKLCYAIKYIISINEHTLWGEREGRTFVEPPLMIIVDDGDNLLQYCSIQHVEMKKMNFVAFLIFSMVAQHI